MPAISITRGSGGNVNRFLPGVEFMSMIGKRGQRDAKIGWNSSRKGRCAPLRASEREVCVLWGRWKTGIA